jgi:hypothetical protein
MLAEFADPTIDPVYLEAAMTVVTIIETLSVYIIFNVVPGMIGIRSGTLRSAVIAVAGATLIAAHQYGKDARTIAAAQSPPTTPRASMKNGAKRIADQTSTQGDNPNDYDIIHDEL